MTQVMYGRKQQLKIYGTCFKGATMILDSKLQKSPVLVMTLPKKDNGSPYTLSIYNRLFVLTPVVEKTKTQAQNSSQKLKKKTQALGGFFQKLKKSRN